MANLKNSSPVIISFGDLKKLIRENVREARLDELNRFKGLVKSESIRNRIARLTSEGCCEEVVYTGIAKSNRRKSVKITVLKEVPEIVQQYMVRKA